MPRIRVVMLCDTLIAFLPGNIDVDTPMEEPRLPVVSVSALDGGKDALAKAVADAVMDEALDPSHYASILVQIRERCARRRRGDDEGETVTVRIDDEADFLRVLATRDPGEQLPGAWRPEVVWVEFARWLEIRDALRKYHTAKVLETGSDCTGLGGASFGSDPKASGPPVTGAMQQLLTTLAVQRAPNTVAYDSVTTENGTISVVGTNERIPVKEVRNVHVSVSYDEKKRTFATARS